MNRLEAQSTLTALLKEPALGAFGMDALKSVLGVLLHSDNPTRSDYLILCDTCEGTGRVAPVGNQMRCDCNEPLKTITPEYSEGDDCPKCNDGKLICKSLMNHFNGIWECEGCGFGNFYAPSFYDD
jgi:hypothetical protein